MARITVEDCLQFAPNRFELVLLGAQRARDLGVGAEPTVSWDNDKATVVALREIGTGGLDPADLRESLIRSFQRYADTDRPLLDETEPFPSFGMMAGATTLGGERTPPRTHGKG